MVMRSFGVVVCVALVAAACSSGADLSAPTVVLDSTTTTAEAPTTTVAPATEAPTATLSPEQVAEAELRELAMAYLTYENNEFEEGRTEPWPVLELMTGRLLDRVSSTRQSDLEEDAYKVGSLLDPVLVSAEVSDGVGRIDFCSDDASYWVDADGNQLGSAWEGGARFGYLSAVRVGDRWLLEELIIREETCDPADYS